MKNWFNIDVGSYASNSLSLLYDAWAAGIVDGEGCITIKRSKAKGFVYYNLCVTISQSGEAMPEIVACLADVFGGKICSPVLDNRKGHRLPKWEWYVVCAQAELFLRRVYPFLVQKKKQAEIAFEYREKAMGAGKRELAKHYFELMAETKNYHRRGHEKLMV